MAFAGVSQLAVHLACLLEPLPDSVEATRARAGVTEVQPPELALAELPCFACHPVLVPVAHN